MALKLQAAEYERRLELLNHSFERSREDRLDFVRKDQAEADKEANELAVKALALKLDDALVTREKTVNDRFDRLEEKLILAIRPLEAFKNRMAWLGPALVLFGGVLGSAITRVVSGGSP